MSKTLYRYNEETCQYERIRVKTPDVLFYVSGVVVASIVLLIALLIVHDYFFDSEKEIALRTENVALEKNYALLTSQLAGIEESLQQLNEKDRELHTKFFRTAPESSNPNDGTIGQREILLSSPSAFRKKISQLNKKSSELLESSQTLHNHFSVALSVKPSEAIRLKNIPSLLPVSEWRSENVISGFGQRINPFHKGLYRHPGIDIALPRGSAVLATATGKVSEVKKATVQAGYGNFIDIDHGNGYKTRYAHLEEIKVKMNQQITAGTLIGTVGSSGGSIAPHLHYEIIYNGKAIDPVLFMVKELSSTEHYFLTIQSRKQNQSLD